MGADAEAECTGAEAGAEAEGAVAEGAEADGAGVECAGCEGGGGERGGVEAPVPPRKVACRSALPSCGCRDSCRPECFAK